MSDVLAADASVRGQAVVPTAQAARYVTQMCKHFAHKALVTQEGDGGSIAFAAFGACRLRAADGVLTLVAEAASPAQLEQLQDVVTRHLRRFAFREELQVAWQAA